MEGHSHHHASRFFGDSTALNAWFAPAAPGGHGSIRILNAIDLLAACAIGARARGRFDHQISSYQPYAPGQQHLHHALLKCPGFVAAGFQGGEFGVHVGEDGGDGGLFGNRRQHHQNTFEDFRI